MVCRLSILKLQKSNSKSISSQQNANSSMLCPNSSSVSAAEAPRHAAQSPASMDLGKIWQGVLNLPPSYTIEVISEIFDKMSAEDKERTLIHELMHIPGGFSVVSDPTKAMSNAKTLMLSTRNSKATAQQNAKNGFSPD